MKTVLLLVRHASTDAIGKILSGRSPGTGINEAGKFEAATLATRLQNTKVDAIYCSPMLRAVETAEAIAKNKAQNINIDEHFNELDFGEWTGRSITSLVHDEQFRIFNNARSNFQIPGGENTSAAQQRIVIGLHHLCTSFPGKTIVVVSHADMIRAALMHYLGMSLDLFYRIEISPASISVLEIYDDTHRVTLLNSRGSLM